MVLPAILVFVLGVLAGLIGIVSMAIRGSRAPLAGAIAVICGVVLIMSMVAFGTETGEIPGRGRCWVGWASRSASVWPSTGTALPTPLNHFPARAAEARPRGAPAAWLPDTRIRIGTWRRSDTVLDEGTRDCVELLIDAEKIRSCGPCSSRCCGRRAGPGRA